jgi:hypothetical protein
VPETPIKAKKWLEIAPFLAQDYQNTSSFLAGLRDKSGG